MIATRITKQQHIYVINFLKKNRSYDIIRLPGLLLLLILLLLIGRLLALLSGLLLLLLCVHFEILIHETNGRDKIRWTCTWDTP